MKRSVFAERHPYWFVAIMEAAIIIVYLVAGTVAHFLPLSTFGLYGLANLGLTILAAALLTGMAWWKLMGLGTPMRTQDLWLLVVSLVPIASNLVPGLQFTGAGHVLAVFAVTFMVGFAEEVFFRGLMLNALRPKGLWKAALITAVLFGLTHAMNVMAGKSAADALLQIGYAIAIGFGFAAFVLRRGMLWPVVLAHFVIDLTNYMQRASTIYTPALALIITALITALFAGYGLYLMLQKGEKEALAGS